MQEIDVCVVGAGVAGIACAQGLALQGASVALVERLHPMPDCLKAEKIGGEGVLALLRLGFQPAVRATVTPLYNVAVFYGERALGTAPLDPPEAGMLYHELINALRENLDPRVDFRPVTKVTALEQRAGRVDVVTDKGPPIACRLVVLATGDARRLIESMGATYLPQPPDHDFAVAFTMEGNLESQSRPVDSQTYHHPVQGAPIAYATFFRLGDTLRANVFCQGDVPESLQRDLKQQPLRTLGDGNRLLAEAARKWRLVSPTTIRKVQVARLQPPPVDRILVLGDAAHTIDPAGGGGLSFSLLEVELLLRFYAPSWLRDDGCGVERIQSFYDDPRRSRAVRRYFGRGDYIFALNHDLSPAGKARRLRFALEHILASRTISGGVKRGSAPSGPWRLPAPYLYEQDRTTVRSWRHLLRRGLKRYM